MHAKLYPQSLYFGIFDLLNSDGGKRRLLEEFDQRMMEKKFELSIIIPVYNSSTMLAALLTALESTLPAIANRYEVILVNDGSTDSSWAVIQSLQKQYPKLRGICLMRNYGQHNALLCGIREARYPIVVTMDDDLQNRPEDLPLLLNKLDEGYDVVYGTSDSPKHDLLRNLASTVTKIVLQKSLGAETARQISQFRVFRTCTREAFKDYANPLVCLDVLLGWGAARFSSVTVKHQTRLDGQSNYSLGRLIQHGLNMLTGFSTLPLRLASINGLLCLLFGLCVLVYVFVNYAIRGGAVPGFAFLASIISIFSGAQLLALGVIGEYLAQMYVGLMGKPTYVVREFTETTQQLNPASFVDASLVEEHKATFSKVEMFESADLFEMSAAMRSSEKPEIGFEGTPKFR